MNRSPEKLDRFIRKPGGSANNSKHATPIKSNEKSSEEAKEPTVEVARLDVSSGSNQEKELSPWMKNGLEMLAPFQKKILKESTNKSHSFEKRLQRLTQKYLSKVEELMKGNQENAQTTARVTAGPVLPIPSSPSSSSSSTTTSSTKTSSTAATTLFPGAPSTSKTPTLLNFFTHSQKETIVPKSDTPVNTSASGTPSKSGAAKVAFPRIPMGGPPSTSEEEIVEIPPSISTPGPSFPMKATPTKTPRKSQPPKEQKTPTKITPKKTAEATPSTKVIDKNDIITLDDSDEDIITLDKSDQRPDATGHHGADEVKHEDVPENQGDADDEKEDGEGEDEDDAMEGSSMHGPKKRKRQRKGDDLFIDMNDRTLVDVDDTEEGRKLTRAARRSGGLNTSNRSTDRNVAGHSDTTSPVKKKTKRAFISSEDSEEGRMGEESMETATEESMDEAEESLMDEVSHISLEDRRVEVAAVVEPHEDTRDREPKPHRGRGDMVRWTCGGKNCTRAFGTHAQVYQHMLYDHPLRPDHSDIVGLCECGLFADFPDLIVHRLKGDKATCGAPHSTLTYWTYDEMEGEEISEEDKERKEAFSELAEELRRCMWRGCSKLGFLFDTFEELEEHNAKLHNIKLLYTCRVEHPDEKSIVTCLSAPVFLEHERKCKSFCFPSITKLYVDKKKAKKDAQEREAADTSATQNL